MNPATDLLIRASIHADVWRLGDAQYWNTRADVFEWAKPRLDDFRGQATPDDLRAAWRRCHSTAEACRQRAVVAEGQIAA